MDSALGKSKNWPADDLRMDAAILRSEGRGSMARRLEEYAGEFVRLQKAGQATFQPKVYTHQNYGVRVYMPRRFMRRILSMQKQQVARMARAFAEMFDRPSMSLFIARQTDRALRERKR